MTAGTLSTLCLAADSADESQVKACSVWTDFCTTDVGRGFPSLCNGTANSTAANSTAADSAATSFGTGDEPAAEQPTRAPAAGMAAAEGDCYTKPQQVQCAAFAHPEAQAEKDIEQLCGAMPGMPGCSLWRLCSSGDAAGGYCQPFSVLGTICVRSTVLAGCQSWAVLCGTPGSVVQQCVTAAPIHSSLVTSQTLDAVVSGCSAAGEGVDGCSECAAAAWDGTGCPDPLAVLGRLCRGSPALTQCSSLAAMCAEAGATFSGLCSNVARTAGASAAAVPEASSSSTQTTSKMYLHASMTGEGAGGVPAARWERVSKAAGVCPPPSLLTTLPVVLKH